MPGPSREQVWSAVFALLNGTISGVQSYSRAAKLPSDLPQATPPIAQPALFLRELDEKTEQPQGRAPMRRTWHGAIIVYALLPDRSTAGATIVNPILDAIEAALAPTGADAALQGRQTLGGLVEHCWIDGDTVKETGDTDAAGQGFLVVPLKILVP